MANKTISLCLISKTFAEAIPLIDGAKPYFDKILLQVNGEEAPDIEDPQVEVWYKEWTKDFAEARNDVLDKVETDYWAWFDTDDFVDFSKVPQLLKMVVESDLDALYLPYDYAQDEFGNSIAIHWRERIIKTAHPFRWLGAVHETLISNHGPKTEKTDLLTVVHNNPASAMEKSAERNHEILEREWKATKDPRYAHYLGLSYFTQGKYQEAIDILSEYLNLSGWDEEKYRSMLKISEAYVMMSDYEKAIDSALQATKLEPDYPDAYFLLGQIYFEIEDFKKCLHWIKIGKSMKIPDTLSIIDPSLYGYRTSMLAAMAHFQLGKFDTAYLLLSEVLKEAPEYKLALDYIDLFKEQYELWQGVQYIKQLTTHFNDKKLSKAVYEALPAQLQHDMRLYPLKKQVVPPKVWPEKSIVFFCGQTSENWGPDTMEKGMGGSEEAIVNLSKELSKLGFQVTVYNTRDKTLLQDGVLWEPWYKFEYRDTYDTLVVWRQPMIAKGLKAKRLFVDVHDVMSDNLLAQMQDVVDKFFVKTEYHKSLYPSVDPKKFVVVGNGIDPSQFKKAKNKKFDVGYFSAPNRGLETLLKLWPEIKKQVPNAKGVWNYGWQSYLGIEGETPEYHRIKKLLAEAEDFEEGGRISHQELAKKMARTKVWAYPTQFPEIHCITALKAQESGMWPVTTAVAALNETVQDGVVLDTQEIYTDKKMQKKFVEEVVKAIKNPKTPKKMVGVSWEEVGKEWAKWMNTSKDT